MQKVKILTVTDLHQNKELYGSLAKAVEEHHPDLLAFVGDFLDSEGNPTFEEPSVAQVIHDLNVKETIFIRGNHEGDNWYPFSFAWTKLRSTPVALHAEGYCVGSATVIGFPCLMGEEEPFLSLRDPVSAEVTEWFSNILSKFGRASRALWLMHEPPEGTSLSTPNSVVQGNLEWREAIEKYQPWLVIFGHDHRAPKKNQWHDSIGETLCVNVGQYTPKKVHYALVEMTFSENQPLPDKMKVTAFPQKQSLERLSGKGTWKSSKN